MDQFDIASVDARVNDLIAAAQGDDTKDALRDIYEAELLDWTDNYDENLSSDPNGEVAIYARVQIAQLWLNYGSMEESFQGGECRSRHVYEKAIRDPFGCSHLRIYTAYLAACAANDTAKIREIYMHGLSQGNLSESDAANLWEHFLTWTNQQSPASTLTMEELKQSIKNETDVTPPSSDDEDEAPGEAINRTEHVFVAAAESKADDDAPMILQHATMTPELLIKRHSKRPAMLFAAPQCEPITLGASSLTEDEIQALEAYAGIPMQQIRQAGAWLLDIVEGLWLSQAFKEKSFDQWKFELKALHSREETELRRKASDPGRAPSLREAEAIKLAGRCLVQSEVLHALINEMYLSLLREQFERLCEINFPYATMALFEKIEATTVLASTKPTSATSGTVIVDLVDPLLKEKFSRLQIMLGALLSVRLKPSAWDAAMSAKSLGSAESSTADPRKRRKA